MRCSDLITLLKLWVERGDPEISMSILDLPGTPIPIGGIALYNGQTFLCSTAAFELAMDYNAQMVEADTPTSSEDLDAAIIRAQANRRGE